MIYYPLSALMPAGIREILPKPLFIGENFIGDDKVFLILAEKPLPVYDEGRNVRDWLYVDDHNRGMTAGTPLTAVRSKGSWAGSKMKLLIKISPKKTLKVLIVISVVLVFFSILGDFVFEVYSRHFGLDIFNVNNKISISTWYSSSLLLICAFLLFNISYLQTIGKGSFRLYWKILTIVFFTLSITKATSFHKHVFQLASSLLNKMGFSVSPFIIALILILIFLLFYLRFFINLPKRVQKFVVIAVMIYVAGSITMELAGVLYSHLYGRHALFNSLLSGVEELFEMIGTVIFLYALFSYIETETKSY